MPLAHTKKPRVELNAENLAYLIETYGDDPVGFAMDICGLKRLDPWQRWYLMESQTNGQGGKKIAIASCHSSGKTYLSSIIAIHRLLCYPESRVIITSATEAQLMTAFGGSLAKVIEHSIIKDWFDVAAKSIRIKGVENARIQLQAWSAHRPESFAGIHPTEYEEGGVCLIADEASAIDSIIFQSWQGNMMHPNSLLIMLGNPLHRRGELFEAFHSKKDFFQTCQVSAYDSSFISEEWIEEMKASEGEDSDMFRVRVLGQFPLQDSDTFISDKRLRAAVDRKVKVLPTDPVIGGIDVGGGGDKTTLWLRQGPKIIARYKWREPDTIKAAENCAKMLIKHNFAGCTVDGNGVGNGLYNHLRARFGPERILNVPFNNHDQYEKKYFNTRTEFWGRANDWLEYGSVPNDEDLLAEGPMLLYTFDNRGRYKLESKERAKERLKSLYHSPDSFDAFAYTFCFTFDLPTPEENKQEEDDPHDTGIVWY